MQAKSKIKQWQKRTEQIYNKYNLKHQRGEFPRRTDVSVRLWLSGAQAVTDCLGFVLGERAFPEALLPLTRDFIVNLHVNTITEEDARPEGRMKFDLEAQPPRRLRSSGDLTKILKLAVDVHSKIYRINKWHPQKSGKWTRKFQFRVWRWLVFVENVIRVLDWVLERRDEQKAFYLFNEKSLKELDKASSNLNPMHTQPLLNLQKALGLPDLSEEDMYGHG